MGFSLVSIFEVVYHIIGTVHRSWIGRRSQGDHGQQGPSEDRESNGGSRATNSSRKPPTSPTEMTNLTASSSLVAGIRPASAQGGADGEDSEVHPVSPPPVTTAVTSNGQVKLCEMEDTQIAEFSPMAPARGGGISGRLHGSTSVVTFRGDSSGGNVPTRVEGATGKELESERLL